MHVWYINVENNQVNSFDVACMYMSRTDNFVLDNQSGGPSLGKAISPFLISLLVPTVLCLGVGPSGIPPFQVNMSVYVAFVQVLVR